MRTLIILVSGFIVLLTAITIIVGSRKFDGVVVEKPYETGLAWDKTEQQRTKLGWNVSTEGGPFHIGGNDLFIAISGPDRRLIRDACVSIRVTRPSTNVFDRTYKGEPQPDGRFRVPIELARYGNWDLVVTARHGGAQADYTFHLYAERTAQ
jgi:nitrogen fixation protein FixH